MKKYSILFTILGLVIFTFWFINTSMLPVSSDTTISQFVINQGEGVNQISTRLAKNKLIRNKYTFLFLAHKLGLNNYLQAGLFKLSPSLSTEDIINRLSSGGNSDYWLKIIDGQRIAQIQPLFDNSLEGYIFPDSYLIPQDYSTDQILTIIKDNFDKKYQEASINATSKLTQKEIIILASLLEREARTLVSKQMVAGILMNRLSINMALQLDATAQYARDSKNPPAKYWLPATIKNLDIKSAYNTYHQPGLPPGPICNPGYDSIYAALHPTESDYMYYLTGTDNQMHYAKSLAQHNDNIAKYLK
ncbi:MAG: endolytic transglycosylase MltG [Microgenomates group bacterium]